MILCGTVPAGTGHVGGAGQVGMSADLGMSAVLGMTAVLDMSIRRCWASRRCWACQRWWACARWWACPRCYMFAVFCMSALLGMSEGKANRTAGPVLCICFCGRVFFISGEPYLMDRSNIVFVALRSLQNWQCCYRLYRYIKVIWLWTK